VSSELEQISGEGGALRFTDNFVRLLGLHALSQNFAAELLGVSGATMSSWMNGKSAPSLANAVAVAEFFQISAQRLTGAKFVDLLENELADRVRYEQVEDRIHKRRSSLRSV
jgi:transcriptional regulator with XRE-family HTH domain